MKLYIIIISISLVVWLLIKAVRKNRNKSESNLTVFEHPSTFKKPDIEMVSKPFIKKEKKDYLVEIKTPNKTKDS